MKSLKRCTRSVNRCLPHLGKQQKADWLLRRQGKRWKQKYSARTSQILTQSIHDSVKTIKGVGKAAGEQLEAIGITTIHDFVMTFPYRHEDFRLKDISETPHNERVTIEGRVESEPSVLFL